MLWCGVWVGGGVGCSVTLRLQLYRVFSNLSSTKISIARCAGVVGCAVPADCPARCQPVGQAVGVSCGWSVVGRGGLSGCRGVRFLCALLHLYHIGGVDMVFSTHPPAGRLEVAPSPTHPSKLHIHPLLTPSILPDSLQNTSTQVGSVISLSVRFYHQNLLIKRLKHRELSRWIFKSKIEL